MLICWLGQLASGLEGFFISNYLVLAQANLALLQGDVESVSKILKPFRKKLNTNPSTYERGLWALLEGRNHLLKREAKKAIRLLQEGKSYFIQDGRESETQSCIIWLVAAYDQIGRTENARTEFRELFAARNKPTHALLIALHQAYSYLKDLQSDPQIGRSLGDLLENPDS